MAGFSNAWEAVTLRLSAVDPSILVRRVGSWRGGGMNEAFFLLHMSKMLPTRTYLVVF